MSTNFENNKHHLNYSVDKSMYWLMQDLNATVRVNDLLRHRSRSGGYVARPGNKADTSSSFIRSNKGSTGTNGLSL